ncbi:MAG: cryptochrome/photolyase family protein [Pseudomonadota bacterium]
MTRHLIIVLGDQLNLDNPALEGFDAAQDVVLMVEASNEATHVWSHKARIVLFLSAMRHFAQLLNNQHIKPIYLKLGEHNFVSLKAAWAHYINALNPLKILICEPGEYRLEQDLIKLCKETNTQLVVRDDTHFMCSKADFKHWAASGEKSTKQLRMEFFYRMMRKKYDVLMQDNEPVGGAWNYDAENRKAFGKAGPQNVPAAPQVNMDALTKEVINLVEQHFPQHPGSLKHFIWPVTREEALQFLNDFIQHKLAGFGDHQDAMWQDVQSSLDKSPSPYLWHSLLSTSLNLKLLNPREVIAAAVATYQKNQLPLASVEGFIRQILGWREFIRGVYWLDMPQMAQANHYNHQRALPKWYWSGDTQMNCMRQTINDTMQHGYAHHIQRLMVMGMFGILAELNPREVEAWYLAVYVDAIEWVELPNVAGMALYANGGRFTSKPYVASGAYIKRMSNYCNNCKYKPELKTGPQACPTTTLYWHFLIKHYDTFARNPRTALMAKNVDRFDQAEVEAIQMHASQLLSNLDHL